MTYDGISPAMSATKSHSPRFDHQVDDLARQRFDAGA
jgi:hypothetical protein